MSLQTEAREDELFAELAITDWDIVLLSETWRGAKEEVWKTSEGHLFIGSGGTLGRRGVAVIIHRRLATGFKAFHAVNERLCAVDIDIKGTKCRFISAYMPHLDYDDIFVEAIYKELDYFARRR